MQLLKSTRQSIILIIACCICLSINTVNAQISYPGKAKGITLNKVGIHFIHLPSAESKSNFTKQNSNNKAGIIGSVHKLNINFKEAATWVKDKEGNRTGYIGLVSSKASSLGLTFSPFQLSIGCKLFVYSSYGKKVLGAYNYRNNNTKGFFMTNSLEGDSIIVELQVNKNVGDVGSITLASVCIGFADANSKVVADDSFGDSRYCHVDINCIDDEIIQFQKQAACKLILEADTTRTWCSGTLVNNAQPGIKPYILTAEHCIEDEFTAHKTLVIFDYESPFCNGPDGIEKSILGTNLIAWNNNIDFALLEMMEHPPVHYYPLYSGWNISDDYTESVYSIHHPQGDVKKIAYDSNQVITGDYSSYNNNTHWFIETYEIGTTERGSSGAALFNNNNQVIGTLSGGDLACSDTINDYYQKLSNAWDDYPGSDEQLMAWLANGDKELTSMDNYMPYSGNYEELSNIVNHNTTLEKYSPWGYVAGHNASTINEYAEQYFKNGTKYIYAVNMNVAKAYSALPDSRITLKVRDGNSYSRSVIFEKDFYISEFELGSDNFMLLDTLVAVDKYFLIGYEISYYNPQDTFALEVATNTSQNHAYMLQNGKWVTLHNGITSLNTSIDITPFVEDYYPPPIDKYQELIAENLFLYPNPSSGSVQLFFKIAPDGLLKTSIYDVYGRLVQVNEFVDIERNIRLHTNNLKHSGVYFLWIEYEGKRIVKKFISIQ